MRPIRVRPGFPGSAAASLLFVVLLGAMAAPAAGQVPLEEELRKKLEALGYLELQDVEEEGAPEASSDAPATPTAAPGADLAQRILKLKLERKPAHVLDALAQAPKLETSETPVDGAERFRVAVVAGDWDEVRRFLAEELDAEDAWKVYDHLLKQLQSDKIVFLAEEVLELAQAAPCDLSPERTRALGELLGRTGATSGLPASVLDRIAAGTRHFGKDDPSRRLATARLLIAAGLVAEARPYLPALDASLEPENLEIANVHAGFLKTVAEKEKSPDALAEAWQLTLDILGVEPQTDPQRAEHREASRRALELLGKIPRADGDAWLDRVFRERPEVALEACAELARMLETAAPSQQPDPRRDALYALHRTVERLVDTPTSSEEPWSTIITLLTLSWIEEAQYTLQEGPSARDAAQRGSPGWHASQKYRKMLAERRKKKFQPIPAGELFELSPDESWAGSADPDLARRIRRYAAFVASRAGATEQCLATIAREASQDPDLASELAARLVSDFVASLRPSSPNVSGTRQFVTTASGTTMVYGPGGLIQTINRRGSSGIPLTRARQVRSLDRLAGLLHSLRSVEGLAPVDDALVVQAFSAAHSPAEIYRREDIERIFGDVADASPGTLRQLASSMRQLLAGQWRKPSVQQQAGTRRTDRDLVAEVTRGYELAREIVEHALDADAGDWKTRTVLGALLFDAAEFLYGQKVDLATYTSTRNEAFAQFSRAASDYETELAELHPDEYSVEPYRQWFQSALGASDLAYLTRQEKPDLDQIGQIAARMRGLPPRARDRHLELFAGALVANPYSIPPQLKPHVFRQGIRILGDHASARPARELVDYYDDLLGEVELALIVEGSTDVGAGEPFGAHLSIRATTALGREAGGFQRYLSNKIYSQAARTSVDYKDDLESRLRETLADKFDVQSLTFHEPTVAPRGYGRRGWQEMPLAYLVLAAKDPAVDRIPSVQVDLEFQDGMGSVLLPISSSVILIDAREDARAERPYRVEEVRQVVDDRELSTEGIVQLEISAHGEGVLPPLAELLAGEDLESTGFGVRAVADHGLNVGELDTEGDTVIARTDRTWTVELEPATAGGADREFRFPAVSEEGVEVLYQRYADADIEDVGEVVTLHGLGRFAPARWPWAIAAVVLVGAAAAGFVALRRVSATPEAGPTYEPIEDPTPFQGLALLERIRADERVALSDAQRAELDGVIATLQKRYFDRNGSDRHGGDLGAIVHRWVEVARR